MMDQPVSRNVSQLYSVCWSSIVGQGTGRERPMPRDVAEFFLRDERLANSMRRYWLEEYSKNGRDVQKAAH
jgi:hypothetical protein